MDLDLDWGLAHSFSFAPWSQLRDFPVDHAHWRTSVAVAWESGCSGPDNSPLYDPSEVEGDYACTSVGYAPGSAIHDSSYMIAIHDSSLSSRSGKSCRIDLDDAGATCWHSLAEGLLKFGYRVTYGCYLA